MKAEIVRTFRGILLSFNWGEKLSRVKMTFNEQEYVVEFTLGTLLVRTNERLPQAVCRLVDQHEVVIFDGQLYQQLTDNLIIHLFGSKKMKG